MLDKDAFRMFNSYSEIDKLLGEVRELESSISGHRLKIQEALLADWVTIDHVESVSGLTLHRIKTKIYDASLVGLLWEKQWYLLRESLEENGYDI